MAGKRDDNQKYEVHGAGVSSLRRGFDELGMPESRRATALAIVSEVLAVNNAVDFYWYMPPATEELCCYWDDADRNLLWINAGELHLVSDDSRVHRPVRPLSYRRANGDLVGWLLPGGQAGAGAGPKKAKVATVLCPAMFVEVPAEVPCAYCEIVHERSQPS